VKPPVADSTAQPPGSAATRASYVLIAEVDILRSAAFLEAVSPFRLGALVARDGTEAIQTLQQFGPPIVLIVSVSLPPRDGFAVMSALRSVASPRSSAIIAIVPVGGGRHVSEELRRSLGISSVLPYAGSAAALQAAVQKALDEAGFAMETRPPALEIEKSQPEAIEEIIRDLTSRATRLTGAAGSVVYLQMKPFERFRAHVDWMSDRADVHSPFAAPYALEWVLRTGDVLVLPDLATQPVVSEQTETLREVLRAVIAVPLVGDNNNVVGALCVFDVKPLTVGTVQLEALKALGRDVGHLLESMAPLPDEPADDDRRQGPPTPLDLAVDQVTGLLTREIGRDVIAQEVARARDLRRPISLVLIGVDHFEDIDSAHGHEASDRALRIVSQTVRVMLRASDVAIRWDAGEFLILLPMVSLSTAGAVAERIRDAVQIVRSRDLPPITVSGGLTELPPGEHPEAAIERVREQLVTATRKGGNRIE
jgi:diguanylate cyclase (GGDEF)-like protein